MTTLKDRDTYLARRELIKRHKKKQGELLGASTAFYSIEPNVTMSIPAASLPRRANVTHLEFGFLGAVVMAPALAVTVLLALRL